MASIESESKGEKIIKLLKYHKSIDYNASLPLILPWSYIY